MAARLRWSEAEIVVEKLDGWSDIRDAGCLVVAG